MNSSESLRPALSLGVYTTEIPEGRNISPAGRHQSLPRDHRIDDGPYSHNPIPHPVPVAIENPRIAEYIAMRLVSHPIEALSVPARRSRLDRYADSDDDHSDGSLDDNSYEVAVAAIIAAELVSDAQAHCSRCRCEDRNRDDDSASNENEDDVPVRTSTASHQPHPTVVSEREAARTPRTSQGAVMGTGLSASRSQQHSTSTRKFVPPYPDSQPADLFAPRPLEYGARFVRLSDPRELLIYTDGACPFNGRPNARGAWAFVFDPFLPTANIAGRLENRGPDRSLNPQTSNRAELRAVIAALAYRRWLDDGFHRIVIATDSEYIVSGITGLLDKWERNGWRTSRGTPAQNLDLWKVLREQVREIELAGGQVQFWHIRRECQNIEVERMAQRAANLREVPYYTPVICEDRRA